MAEFPYFFVGTFIEAAFSALSNGVLMPFPYFFVGTFIEASASSTPKNNHHHFPTFS